jgi:hypothetical protein
MTYFLERIAKSLIKEFGNNLNRHCLVFPSRRAGLYFLKYLGAEADKPIWSPSILTINELFRSYSSLQVAGNEMLLYELYKIYRKVKRAAESFDDFYFWGDMLLNDFDDVDKYLADASLLFRNVKDIKNIDMEFGGLTVEQIEIIKRFWLNFDQGNMTNEKTGFIDIWSILNKLYTEFRDALREKGLAYEGMIFRDLAENEEQTLTSDSRWTLIHFIGFNALNECEKKVMSRFRKAGMARFYWDYDESYIKDDKFNSAGYFLKDNLKKFGNDMPADWSFNTMLSAGSPLVLRSVIETSSDVAQVKLIPRLINGLEGLSPDNAHHTAVVLADENLLTPVLSSLPENIGDINITMGYPLKQTTVYNLLRHLMDMQKNAAIAEGITRFNHKDVTCILQHDLVKGMLNEEEKELIKGILHNNLLWVSSDLFSGLENLGKIFVIPATPVLLAEYFKDILSIVALSNQGENEMSDDSLVQRNILNEFIYRIVLSLNKLEAIVRDPDVPFTNATYIRLLDRLLRMQSVPFSGEPLSGIQVMGILETRVLDFRNLIILSVNEGVLPAISSGASFIPFNLREAFGLPSVNHQESIFAYHFYRLLQRAENVTFTYNSNSEGLQSGEMSRFLIQMKYNDQLKPEFTNLNYEIRVSSSVNEVLERTEQHVASLREQFLENDKRRYLSPSAINTWLNCRMKFYHRYINKLKEPDKVAAEIDPAMLGNILHESMKVLYSSYTGQVVTGEILKFLLGNKKLLTSVINQTIRDEFMKGSEGPVTGNELIIRDVLLTYIEKILKADISLPAFTILNLEDKFYFEFRASDDDRKYDILTGGIIDRIDIFDDTTRIVDYKTGSVADSINSIASLFEDDRKKDFDAWLQTLLYCEAYLANKPDAIVRPSVYKVKRLSAENTDDKLRIKTDRKNTLSVDNYKTIRDEFLSGLKKTVRLIFDNDEPFIMTRDTRGKCNYCPYKTLCMR